jgi:hypothetical protein
MRASPATATVPSPITTSRPDKNWIADPDSIRQLRAQPECTETARTRHRCQCERDVSNGADEVAALSGKSRSHCSVAVNDLAVGAAQRVPAPCVDFDERGRADSFAGVTPGTFEARETNSDKSR